MNINAGTIFGRQPVAWVGAIQAVLAMLVSFGWLEFVGLKGQTDVALVVGVLGAAAALYLAFVTNDTWLAPAIELLKATLAFGVIYGLSVTTEQTGLAVATLSAVFAFIHQPKVSPLDTPTFQTVPVDSWRVNDPISH